MWNRGTGGIKFILLASNTARDHSSSSGSHDDLELQNTQQAQWVAMRAGAGGTPGGRSPACSLESLNTLHSLEEHCGEGGVRGCCERTLDEQGEVGEPLARACSP